MKQEAEWVANQLKKRMGLPKVEIKLDTKYGMATISAPIGKVIAGSLTISNVSTAWGNTDGLFASKDKNVKSIMAGIEKDRNKIFDY